LSLLDPDYDPVMFTSISYTGGTNYDKCFRVNAIGEDEDEEEKETKRPFTLTVGNGRIQVTAPLSEFVKAFDKVNAQEDQDSNACPVLETDILDTRLGGPELDRILYERVGLQRTLELIPLKAADGSVHHIARGPLSDFAALLSRNGSVLRPTYNHLK
jgi:hypothetical protein